MCSVDEFEQNRQIVQYAAFDINPFDPRQSLKKARLSLLKRRITSERGSPPGLYPRADLGLRQRLTRQHPSQNLIELLLCSSLTLHRFILIAPSTMRDRDDHSAE